MDIKLCKDRVWLENKYLSKEVSIYHIAKWFKVSTSSISNRLKKRNISMRSRDEATQLRILRQINHCKLSQEALEWISGELLGDGCIYSHSSYSATIHYGSSKEEYIKYVSKTLNSFGIKQSGKINKFHNKKWDCYYYCYQSKRYAELLSIREKWYSDGKKIVPGDVNLTSLVCRQWYIGDGCLSSPKNENPSISLSTCGFTIPNVEWLKEELIKLKFKVTRHPSDNTLRISTKSVKDFLDYIGPCPVKCYQYKWDYYNKEKEVNTEVKVLPQG